MRKIPLVIPEGAYQGTPVNIRDYMVGNNVLAGWKNEVAGVRFFCPADVDGLTGVVIEFGTRDEAIDVTADEQVDLSGTAPLTIGETTVLVDMRVKLTAQDDDAENGVYVYAEGEGGYTLTEADQYIYTMSPEYVVEDDALVLGSGIPVSDGAVVRLSPADWCWLDGYMRVSVVDTEYTAPEGGLEFALGIRKV
jgi:hypothetical protein